MFPELWVEGAIEISHLWRGILQKYLFSAVWPVASHCSIHYPWHKKKASLMRTRGCADVDALCLLGGPAALSAHSWSGLYLVLLSPGLFFCYGLQLVWQFLDFVSQIAQANSAQLCLLWSPPNRQQWCGYAIVEGTVYCLCLVLCPSAGHGLGSNHWEPLL